jgi:Spy/CpxP family protein refolding chaperone
MSTQAKSKLYLLIIGILLITNAVMLFFFLKEKPGGDKPPRIESDRRKMMRNFLQKEIGFDTVQIQQYDTLSKLFKEKNKADMDTLKANKEQQFKVLGTSKFNEAIIDSMAARSAENQKLMELRMLNHFAAIRKLCTPDQVIKFDTSFYKMWSKKKKPEEKK